jgi:hypothetical protein
MQPILHDAWAARVAAQLQQAPLQQQTGWQGGCRTSLLAAKCLPAASTKTAFHGCCMNNILFMYMSLVGVIWCGCNDAADAEECTAAGLAASAASCGQAAHAIRIMPDDIIEPCSCCKMHAIVLRLQVQLMIGSQSACQRGNPAEVRMMTASVCSIQSVVLNDDRHVTSLQAAAGRVTSRCEFQALTSNPSAGRDVNGRL